MTATRWILRAIGLWLAACVLASRGHAQEADLRIGAKNFAESNLLCEIMAQLIESQTGLTVARQFNLAGTPIVWDSLLRGDIDLYAEYTGTAWAILLRQKGSVPNALRAYVDVNRLCRERHDLEFLAPLGPNNTYALAMPEEQAERLGISSISDLENTEGLSLAVSIEFLEREDGWIGLREAYDLDGLEVSAMEHGLAYQAVANGVVDLIDVYLTDGKLLTAGLRTLEDDRGFFPPYDAAPLVRRDTLQQHPELRPTLELLSFRLTDTRMRTLNARVENGEDYAQVARDFLVTENLIDAGANAPKATGAGRGDSFWQTWSEQWAAESNGTRDRLKQHLAMTGLAVLIATLLAVPLGIATARRERLRFGAMNLAGIFQTIPSLALLALLIQVTDGTTAAVLALILYSLLPILRNTDTGLRGVDDELIESGRALGMTESQLLRKVRLPLALPTILAGVRTATVISIGATTLAAFIGAGGLGDAINTGLSLNDGHLVLCGALPAAGLALAADFLLERIERRLIGQPTTGSGD